MSIIQFMHLIPQGYLFGAFSRHHVCNFKPHSSTRAFHICGKEQNLVKKGNIRLPVAVRGSRTSVLKFPTVALLHLPNWFFIFLPDSII